MSSQQAFVFENSIYIQANQLCFYCTQHVLPKYYSSPVNEKYRLIRHIKYYAFIFSGYWWLHSFFDIYQAIVNCWLFSIHVLELLISNSNVSVTFQWKSPIFSSQAISVCNKIIRLDETLCREWIFRKQIRNLRLTYPFIGRFFVIQIMITELDRICAWESSFTK